MTNLEYIDLLASLRQWAATNPFCLRDPEHLAVRMRLHPGAQPTVSADGIGPKLVGDLTRIADDLNTLARLVAAPA